MLEEFAEFKELEGKTFTSVKKAEVESYPGRDYDAIVFEGSVSYEMAHQQDCCETVELIDICGDLEDLVGTPIVSAEESTSEKTNVGTLDDEVEQWTFYHLRTIKGDVTLRWKGTSNGFYSMSVSLRRLPHED
jgi:hypothetical protein